MNLGDNVWQRRGVSWIWNESVLSRVSLPSEIVSVRHLYRLSSSWPKQLPSNNGDTLVVGGLDFCLDSMNRIESETWLYNDLKSVILSFQDEYSGEAALIFWVPSGNKRFEKDITSGSILWKGAISSDNEMTEFGRSLWGNGTDQPKNITDYENNDQIGLFHPRLS